MNDQIILIYCICDDLLKILKKKEDIQSKMNSAEIMTIAITAALFFGANFSRARIFLKGHGYIRNMLSESRLNRRLHLIDRSIWETIFYALSKIFSDENDTCEYVVDSMPVEVCMNMRSYRCRLLNGKKFIGYCKAKKKFYYGFKLHLICTTKGQPVEFIITPASMADISAFRIMEIDRPQESIIYGDKAYTDYSFEKSLEEIEHIKLLADRKSNAKKQHSGCTDFILKRSRKMIETAFSRLVSLFPRKIHAVTKEGFLLKLVVFMLTFSLKFFL